MGPSVAPVPALSKHTHNTTQQRRLSTHHLEALEGIALNGSPTLKRNLEPLEPNRGRLEDVGSTLQSCPQELGTNLSPTEETYIDGL